MSLTLRLRVGLRREVAILLPVALILLVLLSSFTLFSYRSAIDVLRDESQQSALAMATELTDLFASGDLPAADRFTGLSPRVAGVALIDKSGRTVFEKGPQTGADLLDGLDVATMESATVTGPELPDGLITAVAPLTREGARHFLRVDLRSSTLARQIESVRILTWVVLSINGSLAVLVLLFLRHLMQPYDRLIERARELLPENQQIEDEVAFLVSSFERAVALKNESAGAGDEIATLERTLGPSLESGLLLIGLEDEVLALNAAGAGILGVEIPPQPVPLAGFLGKDGDALRSIILEATRSGEIIQRKETPFSRGNRRLTLGLSVNPLRRDDGSIRAYLVLFADLTETRREAEEERVASSLAQVGELAAGIAHEMRNSLATFRGYLTLVSRSPDDESIGDYLVELRRETDHMKRVLEDFLSFARPESTQLETLDIDVIVRRVSDDPSLREHPLEISSVSSLIRGDAQLLERALRNLLHNAVDAVSGSGSDQPIEVDVVNTEGAVEISIADRGSGVPSGIRDTVFQPFVTGKSDGVGMGLALAHRIVQMHGGRLELVDRESGGTVAKVTLPALRGGSKRS